MARMRFFGLVAMAAVLAGGCAAPPRPADRVAEPERPALKPGSKPVTPERRAIQPITGPALVVRLLPAGVDDRSGWAADIHGAMSALGIEPSAQNVCAVVAITQQESGFRADPPVPGLAAIAAREIERRRQLARVPLFVVQAALALPSTDGRSYRERLEAASTERQLSDVFDDFARRMPLGRKFFADQNPVRTGGPMQVSIRFAEAHAAAHRYPYASSRPIREEVFTRRGGLYFGIAHLLHYRAPYDDPVYRFADYNAGRFASRNAAFQKAVSEASGVPLELDGDLLRRTEQATLRLAGRLGMTGAEILRDLALGATAQFEGTALYAAVFALADRLLGTPAPRAVVPAIALRTAKTARPLTTDGFAKRAAARYLACLGRL
jgi:hypothetical protein